MVTLIATVTLNSSQVYTTYLTWILLFNGWNVNIVDVKTIPTLWKEAQLLMVMLKQLLSALAVYGLGFLIQKKKMENYCQRKKQMKKTSNTGENSTYHSYKNLVSLKEKENTFKDIYSCIDMFYRLVYEAKKGL